MLKMLRDMYGYDAWANLRLAQSLAALSEEQYEAPGCSGHGSIRETVKHLLGSEKGWFHWFDGSLAPEMAVKVRLTDAEVADPAAAFATTQLVNAQVAACIASLDEERAHALMHWDLPGNNSGELPLWKLLLHLANHGTHTRGQIAAAIRRAGHTPPQNEYLWYALSEGK